MEFKFPDVGEGIAEGEIVKWLVKEGDTVKADQNIVQVETDKAVADLPAPVSGKVSKINFKEGDTVKVGEVLCVIGGSGEKAEKGKKKEKKKEPEKEEKTKKVEKKGEKAEKSEEKEKTKSDKKIKEKKNEDSEEVEATHAEAVSGSSETQKVVAAPAVRKLAKNLKIDLSQVKGSGPGGRILKSDLDMKGKSKELEDTGKDKQQKVKVKRKYDDYGYIERIPLKGIRKSIATNMMKSLDGSAQLTAMDDIDVTKLWDLRKKEKRHFEIEGVKLTFLPFIIKACISALQENPVLNSDIEDEEIIIKKYFNIGVAVETEAGLMVPVIKIAEKKSIADIAKEITSLAEKARSRKIDVMDLQGSTFTITNYGSVGGTYATPILNVGNAGILGVGRIFDRVVMGKKGKVENRKILPVSLTFDHRILDGAEASRFLESLKNFLSDPDHLFKEVRKKKVKGK